MKSDPIWLTTSLFAKKANWHKLLKNGINPFINNTEIKSEIISFIIQFNYLSGENIRLAIQTNQKNAPSLSKKLDDYFKGFFLTLEPDRDFQKLPIDGIFLPFPKNTIQYGLYKIIDAIEFNLAPACSNCIIEALNEDEIDNETIVTFSFYLYIKLIVEYIKSGLLLSDIQGVCQYFAFLENGNLTQDKLQARFQENRIMLMEIMDNILNNVDLPLWFSTWAEDCSTFIAEKRALVHYQTHRIESFIAVINVVNKQLGLTPDMVTLTFYFISNALGYDD